LDHDTKLMIDLRDHVVNKVIAHYQTQDKIDKTEMLSQTWTTLACISNLLVESVFNSMTAAGEAAGVPSDKHIADLRQHMANHILNDTEKSEWLGINFTFEGDKK